MSTPGASSSITDRPAVRVICVTFHPGPELADFADSLRAATTAPLELVLVDNGSDQTVAAQVAASWTTSTTPAAAGTSTVPAEPAGTSTVPAGPAGTSTVPAGPARAARVQDAGGNLGYGRAANLGAAGATQPWLVVANPDIRWHPGSLDTLLDAAAQHPEAAAFGPTLLNEDGTVYPSARALPSLTQGAGHAVLGRVWPGNPWTRSYQARQEDVTTEGRGAGWLSGACLLLRREAFEQVGGFDEAYFMFFEDLDLGERLGEAGWVNLYVPGAQVTHVGGTSWRERPAPMIRAHHASAVRYLCGRYHHWYQWPVRVAIRIGLGLREQVELRRG